MRTSSLRLVLSLVSLSTLGCGGSAYVQPPPPAGPTAPTATLVVRPLEIAFDRGTVAVDADGVATFDGQRVGTFDTEGVFRLNDGTVWGVLDEDGSLRSGAVVFALRDRALFAADGTRLAAIDATGQLELAAGRFPVVGITSPTMRLALFAYLVGTAWADDLAAARASE